MPYKLAGKKIYTARNSGWELKQTCKSVKNAKKALSLLQGLESGSIKPSDLKKQKSKVSTSKKQGKK